ncbi:N-chimaerin [Galendromus occidentalis]|uniref:Beta-chimaerin n=1 Tax=Galendromus occidentalis TaxID=34638 RepID=A0AAJ7SGP7_9ACAR|nr:N-chimaerin [Galendromus occidentalis]
MGSWDSCLPLNFRYKFLLLHGSPGDINCGDGPQTDDTRNLWKSYLYNMQQKAPPPKRIPCHKVIRNRPPHYGKEFHGLMERSEAEAIVRAEGEGSFLVRESSREPNQFSLVFLFDGHPRNYRLYYTDDQHYVGAKRFNNLEDLVADGLITMYLDTHAGEYINQMCNEANYEDSPYLTINQSKKQMYYKSTRRRMKDKKPPVPVRRRDFSPQIRKIEEDSFEGHPIHQYDEPEFSQAPPPLPKHTSNLAKAGDFPEPPRDLMESPPSPGPPILRRPNPDVPRRSENSQHVPKPASHVPLRRENRKSLDAQAEFRSGQNQQAPQRHHHRLSAQNQCNLPSEDPHHLHQGRSSHQVQSQQGQKSDKSASPNPAATEAESFTSFNESSSPGEEVDLPDAKDFEKMHAFKVHNFMGLPWCDFCGNFMWGLIAQGVRCEDCGFSAHSKCSEKVPNDCTPDLKFVKRVFGVDLTTLCKLHATPRPFVIEMCIKEVELRGMQVEGLYRISGSKDEIEHLQAAFEQHGDQTQLDIKTYEDINVVSGCLKNFFRLLPIPLITYETYGMFVNAVRRLEPEDKVEGLKVAVRNLPPAHYQSLKYLLQHLNRVTESSKINKMTADNLSRIFAPTLLRSPDSMGVDLQAALQTEAVVVETLIVNQKQILDF